MIIQKQSPPINFYALVLEGKQYLFLAEGII